MELLQPFFTRYVYVRSSLNDSSTEMNVSSRNPPTEADTSQNSVPWRLDCYDSTDDLVFCWLRRSILIKIKIVNCLNIEHM